MDLVCMKNIGIKGKEKLVQAGIVNGEQLREMGTEEAFAKVKLLVDPDVCVHFLYDIEGAILGLPKAKIDKKRKDSLKKFFQQLQ